MFSAYILFILFTFLPMFRIAGISIPTVLFLFPILFIKKISIDKKLFLISIASSFLLAIIHTTTLSICSKVTLKDILFTLYPIFFAIVYTIIETILKSLPESKNLKLINAFIIIQAIFCVLQITNIFDLNSKLENIYLYWQSVNTLKTVPYLEISYRPSGTTGSPIYMSAILLLVGELIRTKPKEKPYYITSILLILLSGARMAIIILAITMFYYYVIKNLIRQPAKSIFFATLLAVAGIIVINYVPFIQSVVVKYITGGNSILSDYSISYRLSMLHFFIDNISYVITGGYSITNFPAYVDNEFILRSIQFGLIGFSLILAPYIYIFKIKLATDATSASAKRIGFFLSANTMTSIVFTNLFIAPYILFALSDSTALLNDTQKGQE